MHSLFGSSDEYTSKRLNIRIVAPGRDAHVQAARQTRTRYDGVRQRAFRLMEGWAPQQWKSSRGERSEKQQQRADTQSDERKREDKAQRRAGI